MGNDEVLCSKRCFADSPPIDAQLEITPIPPVVELVWRMNVAFGFEAVVMWFTDAALVR